MIQPVTSRIIFPLRHPGRGMRGGALLFCLLPVLAFAQNASLRGRVADTDNTSLAGVTVNLLNTEFSTVTDTGGHFRISDLPAGTYMIALSYVGFETLKRTLVLPAQGTVMESFVLNPASHDLEEFTVTAPKQSKVMEAKSIVVRSVDIKEVIQQSTVLTDVADRLSGVRIRRSGSLGDRSDISINGVAGAAIRIYIDGVPMEIAYPAYDLSTLPLNNIKRMDVYKGVVPVDIGTDAMGGAINIITEQKAHNSLRAGCYLGSFNTHMADLSLGIASKSNYFLNVTGAYNYSDNNYRMRAFVFEKNKYERVKRFHDAYQASFASLNFGTHSKKWADELRLFYNYSEGFKEVQNWARITTTSLGEAEYRALNHSGGLRYEKRFDRLQLITHLNLSHDKLHYADTSRNVYSWSGNIIKQDAPGEYSYGLNDNYTSSAINRSTLNIKLSDNQKLTLSNVYAHQKRSGTNFLIDNPQRDYLKYPQTLEKTITGLQYEGLFWDKLTVTAAAKRYFFGLNGVENSTFEPLTKKETFHGYYLAAKYQVTTGIYAKGSYERGYLIPNFEQFVGDGATILRNTNLKPENSHNLNLSVGYDRKVGNATLVTFTANCFLRDQLDIIYTGTGIVRRYENQDRVRTIGAEAEASAKYKNWRLKGAYTQLSKVFRMLKDPMFSFLEGTSFPNHPTHFGNVELEWAKSNTGAGQDGLRAYISYLYIGYYNHTLIGQSDTYKKRPELFVPTQNRIDLGLSYKLTKYDLTLAANVNNLFDKELYDHFSVPKPGRSFNIRIIYEINNF